MADQNEADGVTDASDVKNEKDVKEKVVFRDDKGKPLAATWILGFTNVYGVSADGDVSANQLPYRTDALRWPEVRKPAKDPVILETGSKALVMTPGAAVVLGLPDKGKSLFANNLKARNKSDFALLRYREPEVDSLLYERDLVVALKNALVGRGRTIFIDSLRTAFYAGGGATGKGGVNMGIFEMLTAYDLLAKAHGKVIMFALNPMTNDPDAIEYYLEATRGSVAHTLHATAPLKYSISSRSGDDRAWQERRYTVNAAEVQEAAAVEVNVEHSDDSIADLYTFTTR